MKHIKRDPATCAKQGHAQPVQQRNFVGFVINSLDFRKILFKYLITLGLVMTCYVCQYSLAQQNNEKATDNPSPNSSSQVKLTVKQSLRNITTAPNDLLRKAKDEFSAKIFGREYDRYLANAKTQREREYLVTVCDGYATLHDLEKNVIGIQSLKEPLEHLRYELCSCIAWGTCPASLCGCHLLCPDSFEILKFHKHRHTPQGVADPNSLAFLNTSEAFKTTRYPLAKEGGYCWGISLAIQKFNTLAFFRKTDSKHEIPYPKGSETWKEFFQKKIDLILNNEPTYIPGFANLYEFSYDPDIQIYLKDKIAEIWSQQAISIEGVRSLWKTNPMNIEESQELLKSISEKIEHHQSPLILLNWGKNLEAHVVQAYKIDHSGSKENPKTKICLRDGNNFDNSGCRNYLWVASDGKIYYKEEGAEDLLMGKAKLVEDSDDNAVQYLHALRDFCRKDYKCL